jgi:hypothetical protein
MVVIELFLDVLTSELCEWEEGKDLLFGCKINEDLLIASPKKEEEVKIYYKDQLEKRVKQFSDFGKQQSILAIGM